MPPFVNPENVSCPQCAMNNPIEVVYGDPSDEMLTAATTGAILLGGAPLDDVNPAYECRACGTRFGVD